jgi:hypothetical protein
MTRDDIIVGVKVRLIVNLPDLPAESIGIVTDIANDSQQRGGWRFWLCWPSHERNRYSLAFDEIDLRHFELVQEPMTATACASVNDRLSDKGKRSSRRGRDVGQLRLPLD